MSTAVARRELKEELARYAPSLAPFLPKHYDPARMIGGAMLAVQRVPALLKCEPKSIAVALARIAQWNLDVGVTAHLVPFGNTCEAVADYKGLIELMLRSGQVRSVTCQAVLEGDHFDYSLGITPTLEHRPNGAKAGRRVIAAYAWAKLKSGDIVFEVMPADDIDAIRQKHSKQWKAGPLTSWYARKTVVRQLSKYLPKTPLPMEGVAAEDDPIYADMQPVEKAPAALMAQLDAQEKRRPYTPVLVDNVYEEDDERPVTVTEDGEEVAA